MAFEYKRERWKERLEQNFDGTSAAFNHALLQFCSFCERADDCCTALFCEACGVGPPPSPVRRLFPNLVKRSSTNLLRNSTHCMAGVAPPLAGMLANVAKLSRAVKDWFVGRRRTEPLRRGAIGRLQRSAVRSDGPEPGEPEPGADNQRRTLISTLPTFRKSEATTRRLATSASTAIWLDILPLDLTERIACYVCSDGPGKEQKRTASALNLARTSPNQRKAVVRAIFHLHMCDTLHPWQCAGHDETVDRQWVQLFFDDVTYATLRPYMGHASRLHILRLLDAPNLRSLTIPDYPSVLQALTGSKTVKDLTVELHNMATPHDLFTTLDSLELQSLDLHCQVRDAAKCRFQRLNSFCPERDLLQSCVRHLETFDVNCTCNGANELFREILPMLHGLQYKSFSVVPPIEAMPRLSEMRSVSFIGAPQGYGLAMQFCHNVTDLQMRENSPCLSSEQVTGLSRCAKLSNLSVSILEGAEVSLPDTVGQLTKLQSLSLKWAERREGRRRWEFYNVRYSEAERGVTLKIVQAATTLRSLELVNVKISINELIDILIAAKPGLRRFQTSIADQDESPFDRLETILQTMLDIDFQPQMFTITESAPTYLPGSAVEKKALSRQGWRIMALMRRVQRKCPKIYMGAMCDIPNKLIAG